MNPWTELASWAGGLGAIATAVIAVILAAQLRNREKRQALVDLHNSLTSGETARARNVIGTLLYSKHKKSVSELDGIEAYFHLIWAIQRARNVFRVHGFHWTSISGSNKRARGNQIELALTWNLREIADNVVIFRNRFGAKWRVEDADAWHEMSTYLRIRENTE
jgi:hypothetical protein